MSNQTVKSWLETNSLPASIEDEFKQFNIETIDQIKSKSTKEINVMIDYLVKDPCIKPESKLAISFRSAIMDLLLAQAPIKPQMKAVGVFSEKLVTDIAAYKAGKLRFQPNPQLTKSPIEKRNVNKWRNNTKLAINLGYLPLYKCAYLTYCHYKNSYHIPKEYIEIDNFNYLHKTKKFSGKVEVNEPFNLWAISYDSHNPKRAMYKSYKKICNTIYFTNDKYHFMEKSLRLYQKKSKYISKRKWNKKFKKPLKKPVYKWNKKGNINYKNSAQSGYFTKQTQTNNFNDIQKFIPAIYKYQNKNEFEKAEYLLCWERLKNNETMLDEHYTSVKWIQAFNYLYKIKLNKMEKEIIEMNMKTHKLRMNLFKSINKNGIQNAIELYKQEYNGNESDNDIINELESKTTMEEKECIDIEEPCVEISDNEIQNIIKVCENECVNEELKDISEENIEIMDDERRLSTKLVVTSKDETFFTESGLRNAECVDNDDGKESEIVIEK